MRNIRLPSFPVTGFRHEHSTNTYSGGTVRDLHPIILFSNIGSSPMPPQSSYSIVKLIVARRKTHVNGKHPGLLPGVLKNYTIAQVMIAIL